jgi:hypothetical protein
MDNLALLISELISATLCFVLLRFMTIPYRATGEGRYLGLPLGFGFLGVSYIFAAFSLYFDFLFLNNAKWLQLFTQAYAFSFLAVAYFYSKKPAKNMYLRWVITYAALIIVAAASFLFVVALSILGLPSYKSVDEYFRLVNMTYLAYIFIHTIRSHMTSPDPKTIWIPFGFLLLAFSQYSLLVWSLDSSYSARIGAHVLRLAGLLIFLFVSYKTFYGSRIDIQEGVLDEKVPT